MRKKERRKERRKKAISKRRKVERETGALSWNSPAAEVSIQEGYRLNRFCNFNEQSQVSQGLHTITVKGLLKSHCFELTTYWVPTIT